MARNESSEMPNCAATSRLEAEPVDQPRQERADDEDAGAGERRVQADQPVREVTLLQRQREERIGIAEEQRLGADQEEDAGDAPRSHPPGLQMTHCGSGHQHRMFCGTRLKVR